MVDAEAPVDLRGLTGDPLNEVHRQAELMMADLLTCANAVDAKVTTVSSVFAAISAGMIAGAVAAAALANPPHSLIAALSVWGSRVPGWRRLRWFGARSPSDYYISGNEPVLIVDAARVTEPVNWLVTSDIQSLQRRITYNQGVLSRSASSMRAGYATALIGVALGGVPRC